MYHNITSGSISNHENQIVGFIKYGKGTKRLGSRSIAHSFKRFSAWGAEPIAYYSKPQIYMPLSTLQEKVEAPENWEPTSHNTPLL